MQKSPSRLEPAGEWGMAPDSASCPAQGASRGVPMHQTPWPLSVHQQGNDTPPARWVGGGMLGKRPGPWIYISFTRHGGGTTVRSRGPTRRQQRGRAMGIGSAGWRTPNSSILLRTVPLSGGLSPSQLSRSATGYVSLPQPPPLVFPCRPSVPGWRLVCGRRRGPPQGSGIEWDGGIVR